MRAPGTSRAWVVGSVMVGPLGTVSADAVAAAAWRLHRTPDLIAARPGVQLVAGFQNGARPRNARTRTCTSASAGTGTGGPYWPDARNSSSIGSIPASRVAQYSGS